MKEPIRWLKTRRKASKQKVSSSLTEDRERLSKYFYYFKPESFNLFFLFSFQLDGPWSGQEEEKEEKKKKTNLNNLKDAFLVFGWRILRTD